MERVNLIEKILKEKLGALHVGIIDDSHRHKGHKGVEEGITAWPWFLPSLRM